MNKVSAPTYASSSKLVAKVVDTEDSYKAKFYKLKAQVALIEEAEPKEKGLVNETRGSL